MPKGIVLVAAALAATRESQPARRKQIDRGCNREAKVRSAACNERQSALGHDFVLILQLAKILDLLADITGINHIQPPAQRAVQETAANNLPIKESP